MNNIYLSLVTNALVVASYNEDNVCKLEGERRKLNQAFGSILTLRRLMSYIYGAPILDVSRSHTTTQHSR